MFYKVVGRCLCKKLLKPTKGLHFRSKCNYFICFIRFLCVAFARSFQNQQKDYIFCWNVVISFGFIRYSVSPVNPQFGPCRTRGHACCAQWTACFPIGFTRFSLQIHVCPAGWSSGPGDREASPHYGFHSFPQRFWWFLDHRVDSFLAQQETIIF